MMTRQSAPTESVPNATRIIGLPVLPPRRVKDLLFPGPIVDNMRFASVNRIEAWKTGEARAAERCLWLDRLPNQV
jgi:hypothetical protein